MKLVVIDGQSGRTGALLVERVRAAGLPLELLAVGTNAIATAAMMKLPSISSLRAPVEKVLQTSANRMPSTTQQPTKPVALPIQLKTKSLWALGTL